MDAKKHARAKDILLHLTAEYLEKISNRKSLITVMDLALSEKERDATILISVYPEQQEKAALDFIERNLSELREYIKKKSSLRTVPRFQVMIDQGEKNRQLIEKLSKESKKLSHPQSDEGKTD